MDFMNGSIDIMIATFTMLMHLPSKILFQMVKLYDVMFSMSESLCAAIKCVHINFIMITNAFRMYCIRIAFNK